jgi:maltose alpha-D-glucosyltransferase / alpha-amylase
MLLILHNFSPEPQVVRLEAGAVHPGSLRDMLATHDSRPDANGRHTIQLEAYGYRWYRSGGEDRNVPRD